jgi:hypothetical protein
MERHLREDTYTWAQKRVGIDPSRFGGDRTVLFPRRGLAAFRPIILRPARQSALSVGNQVKARLGSSPDLAEALATTFALEELPKGMTTARGRVGNTVHDFDPYLDREAR